MRLILIASLLLAAHLGAEETVVIHPSTAVSHLDAHMVQDIFLGRRTTWDDGSRIILVLADKGAGPGGPDAAAGQEPLAVRRLLEEDAVLGKGVVPMTLADETSAVALVARTPGAISYVESGQVAEGVKAVPTR